MVHITCKIWKEDQEDWKKCCSNMQDSSVEPELPTSISTTTEKIRPPPPCEQQGGCAKDGIIWLVACIFQYTYYIWVKRLAKCYIFSFYSYGEWQRCNDIFTNQMVVTHGRLHYDVTYHHSLK